MSRPHKRRTTQNRRQFLLSPDVDAMLLVLVETSGRTMTAEISRMIVEEYYRHFEQIEDEDITI